LAHDRFQHGLALVGVLVDALARGAAHIEALDPLGDQVAGQRLDALDGDVALFVVAGIEGGDDALVFGRIFHDKTLQSLGGRGAQPLTAPMVMPWVKYFWNMRKTATMGMAASAAPAM